MLLIARWLVKLIPFFFYFDYLIPLGYKNQKNCKIAGKIFRIKYHVTHCSINANDEIRSFKHKPFFFWGGGGVILAAPLLYK